MGTQYLPDGYKLDGLSLAYMIRLAYTPKGGYMNLSTETRDAPEWLNTDLYDLDARVALEDQPAWQKAQDGAVSELAKSGILEALKERSRLVVHTTSAQKSCLNLVVASHGAKLKPADPGPPKIVPGKTAKIGEGFWTFERDDERHFVGVSMAELAMRLTGISNFQSIVQDKTGLTGRYDFSLPWYQDPEVTGLDRMPLTGTGLALKPGKVPIIVINIDHVEKPEPN